MSNVQARHMFDSPRSQSLTRVVTIPSADREFGRFVESCLSLEMDVRTLEACLRIRYPRSRVQPSELSGRDAVWYAYRDGHWRASPA